MSRPENKSPRKLLKFIAYKILEIQFHSESTNEFFQKIEGYQLLTVI